MLGDKSIRFWNFYAKRYAKQKISDLAAYEAKLEATRRYLTPSSDVLEFGCGTGSTAILHAPRVKSLTALDSSSKMIEIAKTRQVEAKVANATFLIGTLFDLDTPEEHFDVVLGLNVLHLIPDMERSVERCYRLLKPGGVLVASTACVQSWPMKVAIAPLSAVGLVPRVRFMSEQTLLGSMTDLGMEILEHSQPGRDPMIHFTIARKK